MRCEDYAGLVGDLVDGRITAAAQAQLDEHLAACAACRPLVADLQEIRLVSARLDRVNPPERVWPRIAAALPDASSGANRAPVMAWRWLAAAAVLVFAVGTMLFLLPGGAVRDETGQTQSAGATADQTVLIESVEAELQLAEEHYDRAIAGLEQIAALDDDALDPLVAATLAQNLAVIDQAIAESRAALRDEPENQMIWESLFTVLWRKVSLLQDTVALVNEMRKGNQAEAARIVEGLNRH